MRMTGIRIKIRLDVLVRLYDIQEHQRDNMQQSKRRLISVIDAYFRMGGIFGNTLFMCLEFTDFFQ